MRFPRLNALLLVCFLFTSQAGRLFAQPSNLPATDSPPKTEGTSDLLKEFQASGNSNEEKDPVEVTASVKLNPDGKTGVIQLTATIIPTHHIYAQTQPKTKNGEGPSETRILLEPSKQYKLTSKFIPNPKPKTHIDTEAWPGLELQEIHGKVTWSANFAVTPNAVGKPVVVQGVVDTQACDAGTCLPLKIPFKASSSGKTAVATATVKPPAKPANPIDRSKAYRSDDRAHIGFVITAESATVHAGSNVTLFITALPDDGWHIYGRQDTAPKAPGTRPTLISLFPNDSIQVGPATTAAKVIAPTPIEGDDSFKDQPHHEGEVTWAIPIHISEKAAPGVLKLQGLMGYQVCSDQCDRPMGMAFSVDIQVAPAGTAIPAVVQSAPAVFKKSTYSKAAKLAAQAAANKPNENASTTLDNNATGGAVGSMLPMGSSSDTAPKQEPSSGTGNAPEEGSDNSAAGAANASSGSDANSNTTAAGVSASGDQAVSFFQALWMGFIGGIILNVMPCVLPVIGLKVFAFVEQSGESRKKMFLLNFWYSLGVISVFLLLALIAIVFNFGWGQLFQLKEFTITMAAIIFVMGLSFLGIWEIPIPGFMGTNSVTGLGEKEGYEGAFAKGTLTTFLATPCTGPLMSTALIAVLARPSYEIFAIFFAMGLGMASPYLLIGAFPELVRFLPKPGEWMNTFKSIMGFVLIGTVVYLLAILQMEYVVPTVALLIGLWFACWWIGRVSPTEPSEKRWRALGEGVLVASLVGIAAFVFVKPFVEHQYQRDIGLQIARALDAQAGKNYTVSNVPWQLYTEKRFNWLQEHNKPIVLDFTATWCPNCHVMERVNLKHSSTVQLVKELGFYTLTADWTAREKAVEVTRKLDEYGARQIPLLAIYPAGKNAKPILIVGTYKLDTLHAKLREAAALSKGVATNTQQAEVDGSDAPSATVNSRIAKTENVSE